MAYLVTTRSGSYVTSTLAEAKAVERAGGKPTKRRNPSYKAGTVVEYAHKGQVFHLPSVWLQSIGWVPAKQAKDLKDGDVEMRNYGATYALSNIRHAGGWTTYTMTSLTGREKGQQYENKRKSSTFVPLDPISFVSATRNPGDPQFWAGEVVDALVKAILALEPAFTFDPVESVLFSSADSFSAAYDPELSQIEARIIVLRDGTVRVLSEVYGNVTFPPAGSAAEARNRAAQAVAWARRTFGRVENPAKSGKPANRGTWPDGCKWRLRKVPKSRGAATYAETQGEWEVSWTDPDGYTDGEFFGSEEAARRYVQSQQNPARRRRNPIAPGPAAGLLVRMRADGANTFAKKVAWVRKHMPTITGPQAFVAELTRAGGEKHRPRRKRK